MAEVKHLTLPLSKEVVAQLRAGDACTLTGPMYTLRDAGHMRLLEEMKRRSVQPEGAERRGEAEKPDEPGGSSESDGRGELPYGLAGQTIFYAGPSPAAAGRPFGAIGPTTSSRMDFAAPSLYAAGVVATVGKGVRSDEVKRACVENGTVYFATVGGAAAFLAKCVESSQTISYDDLGTEALRRIEVVRFPVFVAVDVQGDDVYRP